VRALSAFLLSALWCLPAAAGPPNFLFIVADDLGYADIGVHGCRDIPTPHIDSIAATGVRFTSGYSNHAFCSPMRAGFLSGRYQHRFGYETNCPYDPQNPHLGLPDKVITIPSRLKQAGYATAAIGKWHLGAHWSKHPNNRGFDFFYGFLGGGHDYFTADLSVRDHEGYRQPLLRNGTPEGLSGYLTTALSKEAAGWLRANRDKPFYLYLAYNAPHTPMQAPEEKLRRFASIKDKKRRTYAGMVSAMDDGIGMVLATLDELGLRNNTVVAFVSDNGGPTRSNGSRNDPLRGDKGSVFEGGIRVPFLLSWPARLPSGATFDHPVITMDLPVTALHLAGAPTKGPLDGVDLLPFLTGDNQAPPHEALFWRMSNGGGRRLAVRAGDLKLFLTERANDGRPALHDLAADLSEEQDLVAERPGDARRLRQLWDAWNRPNIPPAFHGYRLYHQAKDRFYKDLQQQPASEPR
jgi:arylsulfatase A-like enzyme